MLLLSGASLAVLASICLSAISLSKGTDGHTLERAGKQNADLGDEGEPDLGQPYSWPVRAASFASPMPEPWSPERLQGRFSEQLKLPGDSEDIWAVGAEGAMRLAAASAVNFVEPGLMVSSIDISDYAKNSANVEIETASLRETAALPAMVSVEETPLPEEVSPPMPVNLPASDLSHYNPFAGGGSILSAADPLRDVLDADRPSVVAEDSAYQPPLVSPSGATVLPGEMVDLATLSRMTPEQIEASIALLAAWSNPAQADAYLAHLRGGRGAGSSEPPRNSDFNGVPGLSEALGQSGASGAGENGTNLLTRGWEAIDTFGVVSLRRDGDPSTDLEVEEGMVLGALGSIVSVRRTQTELIVETANAGSITGVPDFRPRPRPDWLN